MHNNIRDRNINIFMKILKKLQQTNDRWLISVNECEVIEEETCLDSSWYILET